MPGHDPFRAPAALVGSASPPSAGVPTGSVAEVKAWIGDSPDRARAALAVENERPKPRAGVVKAATALL